MKARLEGRVVLLTGASGGIGRAIAQRLAAQGARLILVGRSESRLAAVRAGLSGGAGRHEIVAADIGSAAGRESIRSALQTRAQAVDVLINCAGVSRFALLEDASEAEIAAQIDTNLTAPILLTRLVLPFLRPGSARILNVGSSFGGIGYPGFSAYCASKFGLRGFTQTLRRELADRGLQIACVAPRATRTALNDAAVVAMNAALGNATDPPERVAAVVETMLSARRMRDRAIGWPERAFLRINALIRTLVDAALRRQLPEIQRHARPLAATGDGLVAHRS